MLTSQQIDNYVREIHSASGDRTDDTARNIIRFMTPEEINELMMHLPDEDVGKVLIGSYSAWDDTRDEDHFARAGARFDAVFNHIAQHRSPALWEQLSMDRDVFKHIQQRFTRPNIWESLDKMLPVILPNILRQETYNNWFPVSELFRAMYQQPNRKELFHKFGNIISDELTSQGRDPTKLFERAVSFTRDIAEEVMRMLPKRKPLWHVIKDSVIGSSAKYVWDTMCGKSMTAQDVNKLRYWAVAHGVPNANVMNARQLCAQLANVSLPMDSCDPEDIDPWSQESMREIPQHRWYKIGNNCFDIDSLYQAVKKGETRNPFDRSPLDVNAIKQRYNLTTNTYKVNPLHRLKEIPMMSKQQYLTQSLANIWSVFRYPIPIDAFLRASEKELDNVLQAMREYTVIPLTANEVNTYKGVSGREAKIDVLVGIIQRILSLPRNYYTTTMHQALEMAINENINARKRSRDEIESESETDSSSEEEMEPPAQRARRRSGRVYGIGGGK